MRSDFQIPLTRRGFMRGGLAVLGGFVLPTRAFAAGKPNMRLGVVSDVHISKAWKQEFYFEKALRWFDACRFTRFVQDQGKQALRR